MNDETAGSQIKYWFLVMSKMFCLRTQLQSLSLEYPQAGDCAPLSPEWCKKALQPFTGGLCWATLLNTSDTFDTLTATVSLWRDHCCRRLLCRWQRLPFRHVSTASIHTGLQKKVNLDELGLNWWGWLQLISWFDTTWCKYNDRSMTKRSMGPSRFQPHLAPYLDLRLVRPHRRTASVQFSYQWLTNVKK
jgi:hypothetical protein